MQIIVKGKLMPSGNSFLNSVVFPHVPHSVVYFHVRESFIGGYIRFGIFDEISQRLDRDPS